MEITDIFEVKLWIIHQLVRSNDLAGIVRILEAWKTSLQNTATVSSYKDRIEIIDDNCFRILPFPLSFEEVHSYHISLVA